MLCGPLWVFSHGHSFLMISSFSYCRLITFNYQFLVLRIPIYAALRRLLSLQVIIVMVQKLSLSEWIMHLPTIFNILCAFLCWDRLFVLNLWQYRLRTFVDLNFLLRRELSIWNRLLLSFSSIAKLLCQNEILFFFSERWFKILNGSSRLFPFENLHWRVSSFGFLFESIELLFNLLILLVKLFKLFIILNLSFSWKIFILWINVR